MLRSLKTLPLRLGAQQQRAQDGQNLWIFCGKEFLCQPQRLQIHHWTASFRRLLRAAPMAVAKEAFSGMM